MRFRIATLALRSSSSWRSFETVLQSMLQSGNASQAMDLQPPNESKERSYETSELGQCFKTACADRRGPQRNSIPGKKLRRMNRTQDGRLLQNKSKNVSKSRRCRKVTELTQENPPAVFTKSYA